jgi:predicted metal-dependent hydrolase
MHPLLRYTLDLFGPDPGDTAASPAPRVRKKAQKVPVAPVNTAQAATESIANSALVPVLPFEAGQPLRQAIAPARFAHPQATREVRLDGAVVAYAFARANRRTIGFVVGPDGLAVRAPRWTPVSEVESALQEKGAWIMRKLHEGQARRQTQESARIEWREGAELPYLGSAVVIELDPAHRFGARGGELVDAPESGSARRLRVGLPQAAQATQIRDAVQAWLMRQARDNFAQRLDHFAPQLGVQWSKLALSNAAGRWGSARVDGAIRLNWRLIHLRQEVIDYVVVHELSHLRVMDHSPRFWDTVASVVPEYAALRRQLKDDAVPRW